MPKVSVIMGAYNCAAFVEPSIRSIQAQTYSDWEMIICDDGSSDDTYDALLRIAGDDQRIKVIRNEVNMDLGPSLNHCISVATGTYLARQDADDISRPTRLAEQVEYMERNPDIAILGTCIDLFDDNDQIWGENKVVQNPVILDWVKGSSVIHATVMMRKAVIEALGGYSGRAVRLQDYELWMRCVAGGYRIVTMPRNLYAVHWDLSDYKRKKTSHRMGEIRIRLEGYRLMKVPWPYYIYILKPLLISFLPRQALFRYHQRLFRLKTPRGDVRMEYRK